MQNTCTMYILTSCANSCYIPPLQDLIVHVRDASHPHSHAQRANVLKVLHQLNLKPKLLDNMIEVLNKTDKVDTSTSQHLASRWGLYKVTCTLCDYMIYSKIARVL